VNWFSINSRGFFRNVDPRLVDVGGSGVVTLEAALGRPGPPLARVVGVGGHWLDLQ
jgi:hypothetical protein